MAVVLLTVPDAWAQWNGRGDKLDKFLRNQARQQSGRTRVIVEFNGDSDPDLAVADQFSGRVLVLNASFEPINVCIA